MVDGMRKALMGFGGVWLHQPGGKTLPGESCLHQRYLDPQHLRWQQIYAFNHPRFHRILQDDLHAGLFC